MITNDELKAMKERLEKATPGPWKATTEVVTNVAGGRHSMGWEVAGPCESITFGDGEYGYGAIPEQADAEFIAHSRTDMEKLIAEVERLRERAEFFKAFTPYRDDPT